MKARRQDDVSWIPSAEAVVHLLNNYVTTTNVPVPASLCVRSGKENGVTVTKAGFEFDNSWVVPHNPYLTQKYRAHINVEVCSSIKSVTYLYKYQWKGHDRAQVEVADRHDEIKNYIDRRCTSGAAPVRRTASFLKANLRIPKTPLPPPTHTNHHCSEKISFYPVVHLYLCQSPASSPAEARR